MVPNVPVIATLQAGVIYCFPPADYLSTTYVNWNAGSVEIEGGSLYNLLLNPDSPETSHLKYRYLQDPNTGELREINFIVDETHLVLKKAFLNAYSGAAFATGVINGTLQSIKRLDDNVNTASVDIWAPEEDNLQTANANFDFTHREGISPRGLKSTADCVVTVVYT